MVEFVALLRPLRVKLVALLCRPSVGHVAFPLRQTQVLYCKPTFGRWTLFGWGGGGAGRRNLPTHWRTPLFLFSSPGKSGANMPASWQPWHFQTTTPHSPPGPPGCLSPQNWKHLCWLCCSHSSTTCDLRPGDSSDLCHVFPRRPIDKPESSFCDPYRHLTL